MDARVGDEGRQIDLSPVEKLAHSIRYGDKNH